MTIKGTISRAEAEQAAAKHRLGRLETGLEQLKAGHKRMTRYLLSAKATLDNEAVKIKQANPDLTVHQAFAKACSANPELYAKVRDEERAEAERQAKEEWERRQAAAAQIRQKASELQQTNPSLTAAAARIEVRRQNPTLAHQERYGTEG